MSSTAALISLVNWQVTSKIRNLFGVVQIFVKQDGNPYLFSNCWCPDVDSLECSTWVFKVQSAINIYYLLALKYWDTNPKWFCRETKQRYANVIESRTHWDMQTFNTIVQKFETHLKKHNMTYPGDV